LKNIIDVLREHAKNKPNDTLFRYIEDEKQEPVTLTYIEVYEQSKKIANNLLINCKKGDRALLLYPAGLEFITAFLGCLYAGLIAVPAYPPRKNQKMNRLKSIIDDAQAKIVMTSTKAALIAKPLFEEDEVLKSLLWLESDSSELVNTDINNGSIYPTDTAFLQYTSGSTGNPKGVMVSHSNVMSNMEVIYQSFGHNENSKIVSWLPHFHDMGLMGGVLQPIYGAVEITFMAPAYFLQKPIRWLQMMDKYKATTTGGPNFAYDLCVEKINDDDVRELDLSNMVIALNGAEPVNRDTLMNFTEKFARCGFKSKTHFPSYGMAETTLMVTGGNAKDEANILTINSVDLQNGIITVLEESSKDTQEMVSSGHAWLDHEVIIVNPTTLNTMPTDIVGEVWVKGSSVTQGYWKNPDKTKEDFDAYTNDSKEGPYLRTGDLGFLHEDELYICGRAKDLLIIRGKNYYPQDIEFVASHSHDSLSIGNAAAFSVDTSGREQLIILQEIKRTHMKKFNREEVLEAIIESIAIDCELQVQDILILRPGQILKTSSGKIQRQGNKKAYLENDFKVLCSLRDENVVEEKDEPKQELITPSIDEDEKTKFISTWLKEELSILTQTPKNKIFENKSFMIYGLDSLASVQLQDRINEHFNIEVELIDFYDYPTIGELSPIITKYLNDNSKKPKVKKKLPPITAQTENKFEKFELNDIQQAYLLGRSPEMILGNTPCFAYAEFATDNLDFSRFEIAWNLLIERHEMLRCVMHEDITQQIIESLPYQKLIPTDISHMSDDEASVYLLESRDKKTNTIPNPTALPLVSADTFILANNKKKIHIYLDMLVCDAGSMLILLKDLHHYYTFPDAPLEELEISFKDYLYYEQAHKGSEHFTQSLKYWRNRLETLPSGPALAIATQPVEIKKPHFTRRTFTLNAQAWTRFQNISSSLNATPTAVLLSLYAKTLATWSNSPHFCINLTHFHRIQAHKDVNSLLGDFTSLIPLEINIPATKEFAVYVKEIQSQLLRDLEHDDISGIQILREMRSIGRETSMPVVFTSTLGLTDFECSWLGQREYTISQTPQVWIDNQIMQKDGELLVNWDCIEGLFKSEMLDCMFGIYTGLIDAVLKNTDLVKVERYSPVVGRQDLLYAAYNQTQKNLPTDTLPEQCMNSALLFSQKEAIITSQHRITYQEFHNASSQIAKLIELKETSPESHVAIILPKGWEQIVSVMACGYAGVAYLPMAIDYPKNRIEYLIKEAKITTILTDAKTIKDLNFDDSINSIDVNKNVDFKDNKQAYKVKAKANELAYTIFTSGSTGKPKGVMITHDSVTNTIMDINDRFKVTSDDKFFAISALNFDLSVYDIYGALSCGASIVIPDEDSRKDSSDWFNWVVKENISVWNSVPALMKLLVQEANYQNITMPDSLKLVLLSGDFIPLSLYKDLNAVTNDSCEIISLGGATEASIWSIYFPIKELADGIEKIPYGYPLANQEIYILDDALDSKPYYVHGDIYIKGSGVAQGYFNDEQRTKAQFVIDKHSDSLFYKTGDIGYFNCGGYIEIVGRDDEQVKIQGYRVELGEIEQNLLEMDLIKEAIVLAKEDDHKHNVLVAYITTEENQKLDSEQLKFELSSRLPEYMIPLLITTLDTMPLTSNGKVDKKTLQSKDVEISLNHEYVAPKDEMEKKLVQIFSEILKVEKVGINDNFFELGGHSLLATQLVSKIRNDLEVDLPLKALFSHTNVSSLKDYLTTAKKVSVSSISVVKDRENVPLSFAQERLWFIDQLDSNSSDYNLPVAITIDGDLEIDNVDKSLNIIIQRHETLRTIFPIKDGVAQQIILDSIKFNVEVVDCSSYDEQERTIKAQEIAQKESTSPFDLTNGPLLRAIVIKLTQTKHILVLNMHHIISDGWSLGILFKEFDFVLSAMSTSKDTKLPDLRIQYLDYAMWQREILETGKLQKDLDYWEKELTPYPRKLNISKLQTKEIRDDTLSVKRVSRAIDNKLLEKITLITKENNLTLNQVLLSLYASLIHRYSNQDSMIIAVPNANRPTSETEEIIGFFVNTMLIKIDFEDSSSFLDITKQVQDKILSATQHQEAPFQSIIENIRAKENIMNLDDSIQFSFNSLPLAALPNEDDKPFTYNVFDIGIETVKTLLTLTVGVSNDKPDIQLSYKSSQLEDSEVENFLNYYYQLLEEFCSDTEKLISLSPILNNDIIENSKYKKQEIKEVYPFTPMQNELYLQGKINFEQEYITSCFNEIEPDTDVDIFQKTIVHVFSKVDIFNMRITQHNGRLYQMTLNEPSVLPYIRVDIDDTMDERVAIRKASEEHIAIDTGIVATSILIFNDNKLTAVGYTVHHAIMDGLSSLHLKFIIDKNYKQYMKDNTFIDKAPKTALDDIDGLIRKYNNKTQSAYWKNILQNVEDIPLFNSTNLGKQRLDEIFLDKSIMDVLNGIRRETKIPLFALINATYVSFLYRLFNISTDVVLFEPLLGKKSLKDASLGLYMDVRPLVINKEWFTNELSIIDLAKHIHTYQQTHLELISMSAQAQLLNNGDVTFSVNLVPRLNSEATSIDTLPENEVQMTVYTGDPYTIRLTYPDKIFGGIDFKEKMMIFVNSLLKDKDTSILNIDFLNEKEKSEQLVEFNQNTQEYDKDTTIHQSFEKQVELTPDATAVIFEDKSLTYNELNVKANQLANHLLDVGLKTDELVAICVDRSLEMLIGLLAILKAGGAYVPIDPKYPSDRISYMLDDSNTDILLTKECITAHLPETKSKIICLDTIDLSRYEKIDLKTDVNSHNLAYVIYTSGSTGQPKGVMVQHMGVVNLLQWYTKTVGMNESSVGTVISSLSFDLTQKNIFSVLQNGGKLVLSSDDYFDPSAIIELIKEHRCTFLNCAPSTFYALIDNCDSSYNSIQSLKYLFLGGEPINLEHLNTWLQNTDTTLVNSYGPTESSDVVSFYELKDKSLNSTPIGKAVQNIQLYVLDTKNNLVPKGVPGELHIGGDGLARAYLNQPELTNEKFIDNPFKENSKIYKTGDLVKYLDDGNIEYLGRIDDQVKIHGFRIELGEIEQQLLQIKDIKQSVVLAKEDVNGNNSLVAYVVTQNNEDINLSHLKVELSKKLPEYMIPSALLKIDEIPLTPNRKVDKKALLKLEVSSTYKQDYVAPRDEDEEKLSSIFQEILNVEQVGIYDNFFELGGHSLLATQLVSKIRKDLNIELPLKVLFDKTDVNSLSLYIKEEGSKSSQEKITLLEERDAVPMSFTQERLWFLDQFSDVKDSTYHIPGLLHLQGKLDKTALNRAINTIVDRHEILRTNFVNSFQKINAKSNFAIEEFKCKNIDLALKEAKKEVFNLETGSLFKVKLFIISEEESYLFINMHHIISDGWSISVLVQEFITLYMGEELEDLNIQFADYSAWQRDYLSGEVLDKKIEFWKEELQGVEPLALPTSFSRPSVSSTRGKTVSFSIDKDLTASLNKISKDNGVTLFMTMLSSFSILMQKYSSQEEIYIGSPIANRERAELENLIGFFVNTIVLKQTYTDELNFSELLQQTKSRTLSAYEHQDVPFEKIVDSLNVPRDTSRSPIFQVMFALQNTPDTSIELEDLHVDLLELRGENAKFDITMELREKDSILHGSIEYTTDLFSQKYIDRLIEHFQTLLKSIIKEPNLFVEDLNILTTQEKQELVTFDNNVSYDKEKLIHSFFEEQVIKTPDNIAAIYENKTITYTELNSKANQLANFLLIEKDLKPDNLVAICMDRSIDMIISLLAVLKSGAAYVPIDPSYPKDRIDYIISDSKASFVFTNESFKEIDYSSNDINNLYVDTKSNNLAYVIYTSGSTGLPKGVMLEHSGVVNLNEWYSSTYNFNEDSANLIIISFGFDAVQKNIFSILKTGGRLILPKSDFYDEEYLSGLIQEFSCTHLNCVPSAFYPLLNKSSNYSNIKSLKYVLVGGEASKKDILDPWLNEVDTKLVNIYGPTECNDISLAHTLTKDDNTIPIGKPINNTQVYILDESLNIVAKGVSAELHIAGDAVSRGYLYQEEMTNEKFLDNPFGDGKLYKTGDLVRYDENLNIEYLGRIDDQVKIRGFRIELGEIEQQLLLIEDIKDAVVLAKDGNLISYITSEKELDINYIKETLKTKLPNFMIPSSFIFLKELPFTPNGKVDKKELLKIEVEVESSVEYVAPRDEDEEILATVFKEVLNVEKIGINDNFFELGGNSILSVQVTSKAKERGLDIKLPELFQGQYIAKILELAKDESKRNEIVNLEKDAILDKNIQALEYKDKDKDEEVFLTGATGFVGKYLLFELLDSTDADVYCLVRGDSKEKAFNKLKKALKEYKLWNNTFEKRVHIVLGDLVNDKLGIDDKTYNYLCENMDRIYHSAAYLNPMASYDFLAEVNVGAIEKVLNLATTSKAKPIEYISTINIFNTLEIANENSPIETQKHLKSDGYGATKFLAEKIILMAQERGIKTNIYRLGLIVGDNVIGKNDESQWFYKLLNAVIELKSTPDFKNWVVPFTPVDFVASSVVALANAKDSNNTYHLTTPFNMRFMDLIDMYNEENTDEINIVSQDEFFGLVNTYNATNERLAISDFITENMKRGFESFVDVENNLYLHSFETMNKLKGVDIKFPQIDSDLVVPYFNMAKRDKE